MGHTPSQCADAALALLLQQNLRRLSFDVAALRYDRPICFSSLEAFCRRTNMRRDALEASGELRDGCTLSREADGIYLILYNERQGNLRRRNFTLAHEIAHIYLGHTDDSDSHEAEANIFASEFLMPYSLILAMKKRSGRYPDAARLTEIFAVSRRAAEIRLRNFFLWTPDAALCAEVEERFARLLPDPDSPVVDL